MHFPQYFENVLIVRTADKNDGLINVKSTKWSKNHAQQDKYNQYNPDDTEEGGYNHFEIKNAKRKYSLKRADGSFVFQVGDENTPMLRVKNWMRDNQANF